MPRPRLGQDGLLLLLLLLLLLRRALGRSGLRAPALGRWWGGMLRAWGGLLCQGLLLLPLGLRPPTGLAGPSPTRLTDLGLLPVPHVPHAARVAQRLRACARVAWACVG